MGFRNAISRCLISYFTKSRSFRCSLDYATRSFYRAANSIFGKIGRVASEEVVVVLQLIKSKCVPVLLYGLEACALNKSQIACLDFVINRFLMKLFNTIRIILKLLRLVKNVSRLNYPLSSWRNVFEI